MKTAPLTVLFLSTGNGARSIIAEAILRAKGSDRYKARSAGLRPLPSIPLDTLDLLRAAHIPCDGLHTKNYNEFLAAAHIVPVDVVVTLSEEARNLDTPWPNHPIRVHWPIDDPLATAKSDMREWKFRKCLATLENRISAFVRSRTAQTPSELLLQLKDIGLVVA